MTEQEYLLALIRVQELDKKKNPTNKEIDESSRLWAFISKYEKKVKDRR